MRHLLWLRTEARGGNGNQGGDICPSSKPVAPTKEAENSAQKSCSGGDGASGDIIRLNQQEGEEKQQQQQQRQQKQQAPIEYHSADTAAYLCSVFSADSYATFDLEWVTNGAGNTRIYAAAFVDSHGNDIILHISGFRNSEALLMHAITEQLVGSIHSQCF